MIDEYNLYRLMGKSEAPNAEPFQDWMYEKVLPAIRETGKYDGGFLGQQAKPEQPKGVAKHDILTNGG